VHLVLAVRVDPRAAVAAEAAVREALLVEDLHRVLALRDLEVLRIDHEDHRARAARPPLTPRAMARAHDLRILHVPGDATAQASSVENLAHVRSFGFRRPAGDPSMRALQPASRPRA